jgi:hypothetical protein
MVNSILAQVAARTAIWLLLERQMMMLANSVDLFIQQTRAGAVESAMSTIDQAGSAAATFDMWRTIDHYAFLRFLYKEHPAAAADMLAKARSGVAGIDSTLTGLSVQARTLARQQVQLPSPVGMIGFNVLAEAAYGGFQMVRGKEAATRWTAGRYLARGVGAGVGQYTMSALAAWQLPALMGVTAGPLIFIPTIVLSAVGGYVGRRLFEGAYAATPGLWSAFSTWMWPASPGAGSAGGGRGTGRPDREPPGVTVPPGPRTVPNLTVQQIQLILMRQRLGLPTAGLLVPLVPTWHLMIQAGLGGQTPRLAAALTGLPALDFVPAQLREPAAAEPVDHARAPAERGADRSAAGQAPAERAGFSPSQQEQIGTVSGPAAHMLGDLLVAAEKTKTSEE